LFGLTGLGRLAVTLKQPSDKSGPSNDHHSSEQVFESKQARRRRVTRRGVEASVIRYSTPDF
jgi:hypothetical protein